MKLKKNLEILYFKNTVDIKYSDFHKYFAPDQSASFEQINLIYKKLGKYGHFQQIKNTGVNDLSGII